jgi:hypothetical protein
MPQKENLPLPVGVREKHGSWHWVVKHQWTKLCRVSEGRSTLYARLFEVAGATPGSAWHAILCYLRDGMGELALPTQKHYRNTGLRMLHHFGHFMLDEMEPTHIAQFLKWCRDSDRATTGNREKAFMSSVFEFSMGEGWCSSNPCRGVRRNTERPSTTYVEHPVLVSEVNRAPPWLVPLYGVAYLLGIRQTDLRLVEKSAITPEGLKVTESKTGKKNTHQITPTVRQFLTMALEHQERCAVHHESKGRPEKAAIVRAQPQIFLSKRGFPWSEWGLQSALRRFGPAFKFRDLRPKAQTDAPKEDILGHTGQMRERYTKRRQLSAVK